MSNKTGDLILVSNKDISKIAITACCNEKEADKEMKEQPYMKYKRTVHVEGYNGEKFDYDIQDTCKYFTPRLNMIRELIACLYSLEGCACGGLCHIVTDDNNFRDSDLQWVIEECDKEENKDRIEAPLCKLICSEMLKLSMQERALLYSSYYVDVLCDRLCNDKSCQGMCEIERGEAIY